jgi:hypothetical protein
VINFIVLTVLQLDNKTCSIEVARLWDKDSFIPHSLHIMYNPRILELNGKDCKEKLNNFSSIKLIHWAEFQPRPAEW